MTINDYYELVKVNTNWAKADIFKLAYDCYLKGLTEQETIDEIKTFLAA